MFEDPGYYSHFSLTVESSLNLLGVPPEYFQAISFSGPPSSCTVSYHESFAVQS